MQQSAYEKNVARRKKQQEEALNEMSPELSAVYQELKTKIEARSRKEIAVAYHVGSRVREVSVDERTYGESAVSDLAKALGGEVTLEGLLELRALVETYSEEKVRELATKRMADGNLLSLDHLLQLTHLRGEQSKWLRYLLDHGLTTTELAAAIHEKYAQNPRRRAPTINPPRGLLSGLAQIRVFADAKAKRIDIWDRHVFRQILKCSPDDCTSELLDRLDQTLEAEQKTIGCAQHIIAQIKEAKERVQRVIQLRETRQHGMAGEGGAPPDTPMAGNPETRGGPPKKAAKKKKVGSQSIPTKKSKAASKPTGPVKKKVVAKKKANVAPSRPSPT